MTEEPAELFAVIGKPVLHSKSPQMHNAAIKELGLHAHYIRLAADSPKEALETARLAGIKGMNITAPFKNIIEYVDEVDPTAEKIKAVNTVVITPEKTIGYNTDAHGVAQSIIAKGVEIKGKKVVVLGAGGASKAAIVAMIEHGAKVTIANRTVEKAKELAQEFGISYSSLDPEELKKTLDGCSIIIGCLSTGERVVPKDLLKPEMAIFDAYYATQSYLVKDGKEVGCKMIDAGDWLVYQGLLAFELFTKKKPPEKTMRDAVHSAQLSQGQRNISLVGFMGSGKDTIAKEISGKTEQAIFDIDKEIENIAGKPIKEIFETDGEEEFRILESRVLSDIKNHKNIIVNCGGGVIMRGGNRKILKENSLVVWLWASPKTILERVPKDGSRPLLEVDNPIQIIEKLLGKRKCQYAEVSDIMINTDGKNPKEISERIIYEINKTFKN